MARPAPSTSYCGFDGGKRLCAKWNSLSRQTRSPNDSLVSCSPVWYGLASKPRLTQTDRTALSVRPAPHDVRFYFLAPKQLDSSFGRMR